MFGHRISAQVWVRFAFAELQDPRMSTDFKPVPAHPLRLMGAMIYDALLVLALLLLGSLPWVVARGQQASGELNFEPVGIAYQGYLILLIAGYFVVCWCMKGQTLGMKSWRLRVISQDGGAVSVGQAVRRVISAPLAWLPLGLGVLWQYLDNDGLMWHDSLSGTRIVVVKKRKATAAPD